MRQPLAQFAAVDETARFGGTADLVPEAEYFAGGNLDAVDRTYRHAQVLDLACSQRIFLGPGEHIPEG